MKLIQEYFQEALINKTTIIKQHANLSVLDKVFNTPEELVNALNEFLFDKLEKPIKIINKDRSLKYTNGGRWGVKISKYFEIRFNEKTRQSITEFNRKDIKACYIRCGYRKSYQGKDELLWQLVFTYYVNTPFYCRFENDNNRDYYIFGQHNFKEWISNCINKRVARDRKISYEYELFFKESLNEALIKKDTKILFDKDSHIPITFEEFINELKNYHLKVFCSVKDISKTSTLVILADFSKEINHSIYTEYIPSIAIRHYNSGFVDIKQWINNQPLNILNVATGTDSYNEVKNNDLDYDAEKRLFTYTKNNLKIIYQILRENK